MLGAGISVYIVCLCAAIKCASKITNAMRSGNSDYQVIISRLAAAAAAAAARSLDDWSIRKVWWRRVPIANKLIRYITTMTFYG